MNCEEFADIYELYSLGLLSVDERAAFEEHLSTGCSDCEAQLVRASELNVMISKTVPLVEPPLGLRQRVIGGLGANAAAANHQAARRQRANLLPWIALAASLLITLGLYVQMTRERRDNAQANQEVSRVIAIFEAPGTQAVSFDAAKSEKVQGKLFIHARLGIVLTASNVPSVPNGWSYESWIVPKNGPPQPVSLIRADKAGQIMTLIPGPVNGSALAAVAVSAEPPGASLSKPTRLLFAAPLG